MSFLADDEDDALTTLEAALAFIDACDVTTAAKSSSSSESDGLRSTDDDDGDAAFLALAMSDATRSNTESNSSAATAAPSSASLRAQGKAAASNSSAVARCRERKKLEVRRLHEEVAELEAQLAHLRRRSESAAPNSPSGLLPAPLRSRKPSRASDEAATTGLLWMDLAAMQARERYRSEALNQRLKAALAKQKKMGSALEALLWGGSSERTKQRQKKPLMGFDLLSEAQKRLVYNESFESHQSRTLLRMRATVEMMYNAFASVFDDQEMGRVDSATQSTTVKTGAPDSGGSFVELRSSTPLRCGCHDGGELIWRFIASSSAQKTDDYFVKKLQVTDKTYEKNYSVYLSRLGETVELHGISFLQRFEEANREVYVWSSTLATSTGGPTFYEKGWIAVTNATSENPLFPSVQHTCHQIFSDDPGAATRLNQSSSRSPSSAEQEMQDFILAELVRKTRGKYQVIQSFLIDIFMKFAEHTVIQVPTPKLLTC